MPASSTANSTTPLFELYDYSKHWRILAGLWALFGIGTAILQCVVLVHPAWLSSSNGAVLFGLYDVCYAAPCDFAPWQIKSISASFDAAAIAILASTTISLMGVFAVLLLFVVGDTHVFKVVGWMHMFSFLCQFAGVLLFPLAWSSPTMTAVCESDTFHLGSCILRWPYLLAVALAADHLSLFAFGMALSCLKPPKRKQFPMHTFEYVHHLPPPPPPEVYFTNGGSMKL